MYLQYLHILILRHHPLVEGPISGNFHFHIFCIRINLLLFLSTLLNFEFWPFIVYVQIVVCYVFAFCGFWLVLLLRISFRVFYAFLLWPGYWASPHWSGHLGSGQTCRQLLIRAAIITATITLFVERPTDDNYIVTTTVCIGQSLIFIQCNNFVSIMGQLLASLDESLLVYLNLTFHTLWSPEHCIPSDL